jgi:hypothetical protein
MWSCTFIVSEAIGCIAAKNASAWAAVTIGAPVDGHWTNAFKTEPEKSVLDANFRYQSWSSCLIRHKLPKYKRALRSCITFVSLHQKSPHFTKNSRSKTGCDESSKLMQGRVFKRSKKFRINRIRGNKVHSFAH